MINAATTSITLADFAGADGVALADFKELNDPVVGGESTGTWSVDSDNEFGIFDGEVVDVPKLSAPGFITAYGDADFADGGFAADGGEFVLTVRTDTPEYEGFRFSFAAGTMSADYSCAGGGGLPFSRGCYKSKAFDIPAGDGFTEIRLPMSSFSDKWNSATGEQTTTCADDPDVCPTADKLGGIQRVQIWGEGASGDVHVEVKSITIEADAETAAAYFAAADGDIALVSFDGADGVVSDFEELNDPVMGGQSEGTWKVDEDGQFGVFDGVVKDVPSLSAPGFIKASADGSFADASGAIDGDLVLSVRTDTPDYEGFRVSIVPGSVASPSYACSGGGSLPFSRGCFKSQQFDVPAGDDFTDIRIPFNSFSDKWSPATGEQTTACADDSDVCLEGKDLSGLKRLEIWAEGANGDVHLEVQSVRASPSASLSAAAGDDYERTCSAAIQDGLRYNVSSRLAQGLAVAVDDGESLAEAVCCDRRVEAYAEPMFTYAAPDIALFSYLDDDSGVTTFFDSQCGIPLFRAPVNRTLAEFEADTEEHGWPSFRSEEIVSENVLTDEVTGYVTSTCRTHLGSYLPDEAGERWCIDLSCVAGNPQ